MKTLQRRPTLAVLAVLLLSLATTPSGGMYTHSAIVLASAALLATLGACLWPERTWVPTHELTRAFLTRTPLLLMVLGGFRAWTAHDVLGAGVGLLGLGLWVGPLRGVRPTSPLLALLSGVAILLSGTGLALVEVLYGPAGPARTALMILPAAMGFALSLTWIGEGEETSATPRFFGARVAILFVAGGLLRVSGILASPEPIIDVHTALQEAPLHLLRGENPYQSAYSDVYDTDLARDRGISAPPGSARYPFYPPHPFLVALPWRGAGLDGRYANVLCDLIAAGVLFAAAYRRGRPRIAALLANIYLFLPRVPFLVEQGWYEPMLAAALGGGLLLVERGNRLGYVLLGLGLTGKQFGVLLLPPLAVSQRRHWRMLGIGLAVGLALLLPFFLWGPTAFVDVLVRGHAGRPVMLDSITLASGVTNLAGITLPRALWLGVMVLLVALVTWKMPQQGTAAALGMGASLLVFALCHTQGYFNYFYLVQFLLLLGLAGVLGQEAEGETSGVPSLP